MSSLWVGLGTAAASLGAGLYSANKASDESSDAAKEAGRISSQSSAAQLAFLREQSNQARNDQLPFLSGGTGAFGEFLRQLGVSPAPVAASATAPGQNQYLVPLPGITTTGTHSKQTNGGGLGGLLDNPLNVTRAGLAGLGANAEVRGGGQGGQTYYNRVTNMIVDAEGNNIAQMPDSGELQGLLHGFNNKVVRNADGSLSSVGSSGSTRLNFNLTPLTAEERAKAEAGTVPAGLGALTPGTGSGDRYGAFFASPGYKFLFDEAMRGARASGAARGSLYSGAMLKELQTRATGLASQDYGNYMQRLAEATRVGQAAASGTAANASSLGANGATVIGNAGSDAANARLVAGNANASSIIGANNAFQNTLGSGLTALGDYYRYRTRAGAPG